MANPDPFRQLSRHTNDALENTPEVMAMRAGERYIPQTWGSLASAVVEAGLVEPDIEAVCEFLNIYPEALAMPDIVIETETQVWKLQDAFTAGKKEKLAQEQGSLANKYDSYVRVALEDYAVEDHEAVGAQYSMFQNIVSSSNEIEQMDPALDPAEWDRLEQESGLLRLKRNAISSGLAIGLDEFTQLVFSSGEDTFFTETELAQVLLSVIGNLESEYYIRLIEDLPLSHVTLGKSEVGDFFRELRYTFMMRIEQQVQEQWEEVEKLMRTRGREHPAITGEEH
jgi:hypothetical protein